MTRRPASRLILTTFLAACALSESNPAVAQIPQHYTHKQLKLMEAKAANAGDYQKLATYFHYRAMLFNAKAQQTLDEASRNTSRYPMATKTVTRAEVTKRAYDECKSKAEESASLASKYDQILIGLGAKPVSESAIIVSAKSSQSTRDSAPVSDFVPSKK